jgi:site-specific DNA recombinase
MWHDGCIGARGAERAPTTPGDPMPNVVTYCRVSSDEQAEKDNSIPAQRKALRAWVAQNPGHHLVADFVDEGISAYAPADRRPGFCDMISFCRKNGVDIILVHKLDRFSRNREESILFKGLLRKHGVQVKSASESYDPESPQGFLYEGMIEVINQFYSMNLATETLKGMRENASRGWVNGGFTPFGYRREKVTDAGGREHWTWALGKDDDVALVREIFTLATDHGRGAKSIAAELNERGLLSPTGTTWSPSSVSAILCNPVYVGDVVWMKSKKKGRTGRAKAADDERVVMRDAHPAIVDRETFERRLELASKRKFAVHSSPHNHVAWLLSRLMKCEACGGTFVGRRREYTNRKGQSQVASSYYCSGYVAKGNAVCKSLPIDSAWIEGIVVDALRARFVDPEGWEDLAGRLRGRIEARRKKYGLDPKTAQAKLVEIDRKIQNYYRALGEGLDPQACKALIADLQAKRAEIEREVETLQKEDYYGVALEKNLAVLTRFREKLVDGFERLPFGVRRQVVLAFVESIAVRERREVVIHLKVRLDNEGIQHLTDEMDAVDKGTWEAGNEEGLTAWASPRSSQGPNVPSGPRWLPLLDLNQRPSD